MSNPHFTDEYVLSIDDVPLCSRKRVSLAARRGDVFAVREDCSELFDLASGLVDPAHGSVMFAGRDWARLDPFTECRLRSDIGRTFPSDKAWVENLSLRLNIGLRTIHSGRLSATEADTEILELADNFEVSSFLDSRPEGVSGSVLTRCQWIRALLGNPRLLLLQAPETDLSEQQAQVIRSHVREYIGGGGTVLWADSGRSLSAKEFSVNEIKDVLYSESNYGKEE